MGQAAGYAYAMGASLGIATYQLSVGQIQLGALALSNINNSWLNFAKQSGQDPSSGFTWFDVGVYVGMAEGLSSSTTIVSSGAEQNKLKLCLQQAHDMLVNTGFGNLPDPDGNQAVIEDLIGINFNQSAETVHSNVQSIRENLGIHITGWNGAK